MDRLTSRMRDLRLAGELGQALHLGTRGMAEHPGQPAIMGEAIRALILCNQPETAAQLYRVYSSAEMGGHNLEPEALVRLALQLGRTDLIEGMPRPEAPVWLAELLAAGAEPNQPLQLKGMDLSAADGPTVFQFSGDCPYCGHPGTVRIRGNLLVVVTGLCPACFGSYTMDYEHIRRFIPAHCPTLLAHDVCEIEWDLVDHIRPRLLETEAAPEVVLNLGQDYHFLLNELLARHLIGGAEGAP